MLLEALYYHAQQAAEKGLQAVLLHHSHVPPRTHNLSVLADEVARLRFVPDVIRDATVLTVYAIMSRYPGEHEPIAPSEYREALRLASSVVAWAEGCVLGTPPEETPN